MRHALADKIAESVEAGLVSKIPRGPLTIYNYSREAMITRDWRPEVRASRGLVLDSGGHVVARPWEKFFNVGELPETEPANLPATVPEVSEKYDGSLIIAFYHDGWKAITRGCWDNLQTRFANNWLAARGGLMRDRTHLFELVAPWNRIVVPYGREDMVLIGAVETESDKDMPYSEVAEYAKQLGVTPVCYESRPLETINREAAVKDAEGFVARYPNGMRVKIKYAEYLRLHKILTGLSAKSIWEHLSSGVPLNAIDLPDEFLAWYRGISASLVRSYRAIEQEAQQEFGATPKQETRKEYAMRFKKSRVAPILFQMLDGRDYSNTIWRMVKPVGAREVFSNVEAAE